MKCSYNDYIKKINEFDEVAEANYLSCLEKYFELCHSKKNGDNFYDDFIIDLDYSLHIHGLLKSKRLNAYLLTDYIRDNIYLVNNRKSYRLVNKSSIIELGAEMNRMYDQSEEDKYGDAIIDLMDLNYIAYHNKEFANKILIKLVGDEIKEIKFQKLFTLYTAKYILDLIIEFSDSNNEEFDDYIKFIFETFEDFTLYRPNWMNLSLNSLY